MIRPLVGRSKPAIIRSVVVLPQPDGPSSVKNSPGGIVEVDAGDRDVLAERLRQFLELDLTGHQTSRVASEVASWPPAKRR